MSLLSSFRKSLALVAVTLTLTLSGIILPTNISAARESKTDCPRYSTYSTYYSDASMSEEVGTLYVACNGRATKTGRITPYRTEEIIDVCINCLPQ